MPLARISLTLSRHFSLSFITSDRSSGLEPVSSHSCCMYVRAGRPAFAWPYAGVHRSTSLMSSSLLLQQCPVWLVRLAWIVFVVPDKKTKIPYSDFKPKIRQIITKKWQQLWEKNPHKLLLVQPFLKERNLVPNNTRREETTLVCLRFGHTRLTHSFILKDGPSPKTHMWKPVHYKPHLDRMHKTNKHSTKVSQCWQHGGTI